MSWLLYLLVVVFTITFLSIFKKRYFSPRYRPYLGTMALGGLAVFLAAAMVVYPEVAFNASVSGLQVWWNVVFPALLPFFIGSELLMGMGVVNGMGVLMEPLMRPVFNVPGEGSFVMAVGLASGFPIGAILTARLRRDGYCTRAEGERLMSFCNTADPLFMFGAVAVGMLGQPALGATIALAHYLSALSVGMVMRFYHRGAPISSDKTKQGGNIFLRAVKASHLARIKDGRPIGQLLGDTIRNSINTLLLIGGFIMLFSVIINIMEVVGVIDFFGRLFIPVMEPLGLHPSLFPALFSGLFEIDLGCKLAADLSGTIPLTQIVVACSAMIGWSGLSVHAQVASIISDTDMSVLPYSIARIFQGILAGLYTLLLIGSASAIGNAIPVFYQTAPAATPSYWWIRTLTLLNPFILFIAAMLLLSVIVYAAGRMRVVIFRISPRHRS